MGSNGEAVSLTEIEKLELLRKVREMARPGTKIIAGLGLNSKCIFFVEIRKGWTSFELKTLYKREQSVYGGLVHYERTTEEQE
jgi:hypothetical protein